jgi:hypothetical protein
MLSCNTCCVDAIEQMRSSSMMALMVLGCMAFMISSTTAVYFNVIEGNQKCFIEEGNFPSLTFILSAFFKKKKISFVAVHLSLLVPEDTLVLSKYVSLDHSKTLV